MLISAFYPTVVANPARRGDELHCVNSVADLISKQFPSALRLRASLECQSQVLMSSCQNRKGVGKAKGLGRGGGLKSRVRQLHDLRQACDPNKIRMLLTRLQPQNVKEYNIGAKSYARSQHWAQVLVLLEEMDDSGFAPDLISLKAAFSACESNSQWDRPLVLLNEMGKTSLTPDTMSFSKVISACEKGMKWEHSLSLFEEMQLAGLTPNDISFSAVISACEKGGQWERALSWLRETRTANITPSMISLQAAASACKHLGKWEQASSLIQEMRMKETSHDGVLSAEEWNARVRQIFPDQPALCIHQLDMLDPSVNPNLTGFWKALRSALDTDKSGGGDIQYWMSPTSGELYFKEDEDSGEQWYLASQEEDDGSGEGVELLEGLWSFDLPEVKQILKINTVLRVPDELLRAYKTEVVKFILKERQELKAILDAERKKNRSQFQVKWEDRVLRRSFDGKRAKQSDLRFHRDAVPKSIETGVLCAYTVVTVLENYDPPSEQSSDGMSLDLAGTVFKLDKYLVSRKRNTLYHMNGYRRKPKRGDGFMYWHSRSIPGTATIFNNFDDASPWLGKDDESVTVQHSHTWTPQMTHSVAEVKQRQTSGSQVNRRSRSILQSTVTFCSLEETLSESELFERLDIVGLGSHVAHALIN